jgi:hypothetical protein
MVSFEDGEVTRVKESELNRPTERQLQLMKYIWQYNTVIYIPTNEEVLIQKVDFLHGTTEIKHIDGGSKVVIFESLKKEEVESESSEPQIEKLGKFTELAFGIGEFTDMKNKQYGSSVDTTYEMTKVLMERYTYDEENYLIPKDLLKHLLLNVRIMDKQNRLFNNPTGEGDSESPYKDITGYGLIGVDMVAK